MNKNLFHHMTFFVAELKFIIYFCCIKFWTVEKVTPSAYNKGDRPKRSSALIRFI